MIKEINKPIPVDMSFDVSKMKGHTTIILKDEKTGEEEIHEDDNMMTNAIRDYFANCGFLNYPNINRANMVELLLGGIMAFDDEIPENADTVHVPAGLNMIANGSVGTLNNGEVLEMGSYSSTESGWQQDGSYVQTYDFTTSQANGTIACVCLTGQAYGYAGEGNSISGVRHATKSSITGLAGSVTAQSGLIGTPFNIDLVDSSCNTFAVETRTDPQTEEEYTTGVLRKYRLPISKINIKTTMSTPVLLSEEEINIDTDLQTASFLAQPHGSNLAIWNVQDGTAKWGNGWTQYIWTLSPSGTITKESIANTSGVTLYGLQAAHFDGSYVFFVSPTQTSPYYFDTTTIYVLNRSNGAIAAISNPYGNRQEGAYAVNWRNKYEYNGWNILHGSGNGRIVTSGNFPFVVDAVKNACYPTNASVSSLGDLRPVSGLIRSIGGALYREQGYIASINNLENPVVKTAEKSMKIIYRITFEEEQE